MEKQLLYLLDYDLRFEEAEALKMWQPFLAAATAASAARRAARERSAQEARRVVVERVSRSSLRQKLSVIVPPLNRQLSTPEPSPVGAAASAVSAAPVASKEAPSPTSSAASEQLIESAASSKPASFLAVPAVSQVHLRGHSVPAPGKPGMMSTISLASTTSEVSTVGSLTDDAGTSSSSDDEVKSPLNNASPSARPRAAFMRLLGAGIAKPRSRHASASTLTPGVYASASRASSSESVDSPPPRPHAPIPTLARRPGTDVKRFSSVYSRKPVGGPAVEPGSLASSSSTASFLSRLWGSRSASTTLDKLDKTAPPGEVHVVDSGDDSDAPLGGRIRGLSGNSQRAHPLGPRNGVTSLRRLVRVPSQVFNRLGSTVADS
jgi:hypothetical protein